MSHFVYLAQFEVMTVPCGYSNDGDRRINNLLPDSPVSLDSLAKRGS
jgi:hypothetical protein